MSDWIEWGGGSPPVSDDILVDVKFRSSYIEHGMAACDYWWEHTYEEDDIIAYRTHVSPEQRLIDACKNNRCLLPREVVEALDSLETDNA